MKLVLHLAYRWETKRPSHMTLWKETRSLTIHAPTLEPGAYVFITTWDFTACSGIREDNYMSKHPFSLFSVGILGANPSETIPLTCWFQRIYTLRESCPLTVSTLNYSGWKTEWAVTGFINWTAETDGWKKSQTIFIRECHALQHSGTITQRQYKYNVLKFLRLILYIKKTE